MEVERGSMMKKTMLMLTLLLSILFLLVSCSQSKEKETGSDTVSLPVISIEGTETEIYAAFYKDGFDFNYDNLPTLTLVEKTGVLNICLSDAFDQTVQLEEDYYTYTENSGTVGKETYELIQNEQGVVSLTVNKRGDIKEESALYFLKNEQGTFVFKVILV